MAGNMELLIKILADTSDTRAKLATLVGEVRGTTTAIQTQGAVTVRSEQQQTKAINDTVRAAFSKRGAFGDMLQSISGAAAVASVFARNNEQLRRSLETVSLTLIGVVTIARTFGSVVRLVAGSAILFKIGLLGGLVAATIYLMNNWERARQVAVNVWTGIKDIVMQVASGLKDTLMGLGKLLLGIFTFQIGRGGMAEQGMDQITSGLNQLRNVAVTVAPVIKEKLEDVWQFLKDLLGDKKLSTKGLRDAVNEAGQVIDRWLARQFVLAEAALTVEDRLRLQIDAVQKAIGMYEQLERRLGKTAQIKAMLSGRVYELTTQLKGLAIELDKTRKALADEEGIRQVDTIWNQIIANLEQQGQILLGNQEATEEERRRLAQETSDLIDEANQQAIDSIEQREQEAFENTKQLIADEATLRKQATQDRLDEIDVERQLAEIEGKSAKEIKQQELVAINALIDAMKKRRDELVAFKAALASLTPEEREPFQPMLDELKFLEELLKRLGIRFKLVAAEAAVILTPMQDFLKNTLEPAFTDFFRNILSGAKSIGESIRDFFANIVNSIINMLAGIAAKWILSFLIPGIRLFEKGGVAAGGFAFAGMQHGGIVNKPTLAMMGEGHKPEAVVPLQHGNIPVRFTGDREPQVIDLKLLIQNVLPGEVRPMTPDEVHATIANNLLQRGVVYHAVKIVVPRR